MTEKQLQEILDEDKVVTYDIEVFSTRWSVVFKEYDDIGGLGARSQRLRQLINKPTESIPNELITTISFDPAYDISDEAYKELNDQKVAELKDYLESHDSHVFVGYNNSSYDKHILWAIAAGENPYWLNQFVIPFSNWFNLKVSSEDTDFWGNYGRLFTRGVGNTEYVPEASLRRSLTLWNLKGLGWEGSAINTSAGTNNTGVWKLSKYSMLKIYKDWTATQTFRIEQDKHVSEIPNLNRIIYVDWTDIKPDLLKDLKVNELDLMKSPQIVTSAATKSLKSHAVRMGFSLADVESLSNGAISFVRTLPLDIVTDKEIETLPEWVKHTPISNGYHKVVQDSLWNLVLNYNTIDVVMTEHLLHKAKTWLINSIDSILMLREEYRILIKTPDFINERKGFYNKAVRYMPVIEKELGANLTTLLSEVKADLGSFATLRAIKGVTQAVRFEHLAYMKDNYKCERCEKGLKLKEYDSLKNFDKTTWLHQKLHSALMSHWISASNKGMDRAKIKDNLTKVVRTLKLYVKYNEILELNSDSPSDKRYELTIDNYIPTTYLSQTQATRTSAVVTMFNRFVKRTVSGYSKEDKNAYEVKHEVKLDMKLHENLLAYVNKHNPKAGGIYTDMLKSVSNTAKTPEQWATWSKLNKPIDFQEYGMRNDFIYTMNIGGLHAALPRIVAKNVMLTDVTSYYPNMLLNFELYDNDNTNKFNKSVLENLVSKSTFLKGKLKDMPKGPEKSALATRRGSYKLGINTIFGTLGAVNNPIYNYGGLISTTLNGQIILMALIFAMDPTCLLIQGNTDGIIHKPDDEAAVIKLIEEWDRVTGLSMENEYCPSITQKDVNSYILDKGFDHNGNPIIKAIGDYKHASGMMTHDNDKITPVTNQVVIESIISYLVHGIPVEDSIMKEENLLKFTALAKSGNKFDAIAIRNFDETDTKLYTAVERANKFDYIAVDRKYRKLKMIDIIPGGNLRIYKAIDGNIFTKVSLDEFGAVDKDSKAARVSLTTNKTGLINGDIIDLPKSEWSKTVKLDYTEYIKEAIRHVALYKTSAMRLAVQTQYKTNTDILRNMLKQG